MKKIIQLSFLFTFNLAISQVGVNTTTPDASLHIQSTATDGQTKALEIKNPALNSMFSVYKNNMVSVNNPTPLAASVFDSPTNKILFDVTGTILSRGHFLNYISIDNSYHPVFFGASYRGTDINTPNFVLNNDVLNSFISRDFKSHRDAVINSTFTYGGADIYMKATENYSATAKGCKIEFNTTQNGQNVQQKRLSIEHNGFVAIGNITPTANLHVSGEVRIGSTAAAANTVGAGGLRYSGGNIQFSNGTAWTNLGGGASGWALTGNAITATDFLGSTNNFDVVFKRNNVNSGLISTTNTSFGLGTLTSILGSNNTAFGLSALSLLNSAAANNNIAFGKNALRSAVNVFQNTAVGTNALELFTTGNNNSAFGFNALSKITLGQYNNAFGESTFNLLTLGTGNTTFGSQSSINITTGNYNTALGHLALSNSTSGNNNIAIGYGANVPNITGSGQMSIGNVIYGIPTAGITNIGISQPAPTAKLDINGELKIGSVGTAANVVGAGGLRWDGSNVQFSNGSTWANLGGGASGWGLTGNAGTVAGTNFIGTTDDVDVEFRRNNFNSGRIRSDAVSFGLFSLAGNTIGFGNVAFGNYALAGLLNVPANMSNTAIGHRSLSGIENGENNTAVGFDAFISATEGSGNVGVGSYVLQALQTGNNNLSVGFNSLSTLTTGNNNIGIGYNSDVPVATGSNQIRMGDTNITYAGTQVAWTITSDKKWKSNIQETKLGLNFIKQLKPVQYTRNNDKSQKTEYGLIAQDLEKTLEKNGENNSYMLHKADDGSLGVRYNDLLAPMIKAMQEQQTLIENLQKEILELKKEIKR